jgi:hypothetical protein
MWSAPEAGLSACSAGGPSEVDGDGVVVTQDITIGLKEF